MELPLPALPRHRLSISQAPCAQVVPASGPVQAVRRRRPGMSGSRLACIADRTIARDAAVIHTHRRCGLTR